jgi:hypothetical protein
MPTPLSWWCLSLVPFEDADSHTPRARWLRALAASLTRPHRPFVLSRASCGAGEQAFYWREMIDWCRNRSVHGRGTGDDAFPAHASAAHGEHAGRLHLSTLDGLPASSGKRQAYWGAGDGVVADESAEVDLLNRLVKRCRCHDDNTASPTPQSPGSSIMWDAAPP